MVLLDAGHGAYAGGEYYCIAKGKLFKHPKEYGFHNSGYFYEGQWNREMLTLVKEYLDLLGIPHRVISPEITDSELSHRVKLANAYHKVWPEAFVISLHANASIKHDARGYEVYTSRGKTESDKLATIHYDLTKLFLGERITLRSDKWSDGDPDKEANFYILTKTTCPAILVEHLFFDHLEDAKLLFDESIKRDFALTTALTAKAFLNSRHA